MSDGSWQLGLKLFARFHLNAFFWSNCLKKSLLVEIPVNPI